MADKKPESPKPGDVVRLRSDIGGLLMTVGRLGSTKVVDPADSRAKAAYCFWTQNGDVRDAVIPVAALTVVEAAEDGAGE